MKKDNIKKGLPEKPYSLDSYEDIVILTGKIINGLLKRGELSDITRQDAHTIFIGAGYLTNAMREARGGKMKMSVYLQDVHNHRINFENVPSDQIDRFLQGSEEVQLEVLQHIKTQGNLIDAEVRPIVKKMPTPRVDTKLISDLSGLDQEKVKDILKEDLKENEIIDIEVTDKPIHDWKFTAGGVTRFCSSCGTQRAILQTEDMTSICSKQWGLH